jgi:hypothetical protein
MKFWVVLILSATLVACRARSSDEDQVRALVDAAEIAAEDRDASDVLEFVADDYEDSNGFDKAQLQSFLRAWFLAHPKVELVVSIDTLEFPVDGLARAEIAVTNVDLASPDRARLKVELRRRDGEWRVTRADRVGR